jgi:hypothetical protein
MLVTWAGKNCVTGPRLLKPSTVPGVAWSTAPAA